MTTNRYNCFYFLFPCLKKKKALSQQVASTEITKEFTNTLDSPHADSIVNKIHIGHIKSTTTSNNTVILPDKKSRSIARTEKTITRSVPVNSNAGHQSDEEDERRFAGWNCSGAGASTTTVAGMSSIFQSEKTPQEDHSKKTKKKNFITYYFNKWKLYASRTNVVTVNTDNSKISHNLDNNYMQNPEHQIVNKNITIHIENISDDDQFV